MESLVFCRLLLGSVSAFTIPPVPSPRIVSLSSCYSLTNFHNLGPSSLPVFYLPSFRILPQTIPSTHADNSAARPLGHSITRYPRQAQLARSRSLCILLTIVSKHPNTTLVIRSSVLEACWVRLPAYVILAVSTALIHPPIHLFTCLFVPFSSYLSRPYHVHTCPIITSMRFIVLTICAV